MEKIKLIASDLDGTIIPEGAKDLEPGFKDVLQQLLDQGIIFYAASGRPYASMKIVLREFVDQIGFICENGSLVMEKGEIALVKTIPDDLARSVANDLLADPNVEIQLSGAAKGYLVPRREWFVDYMENIVKNDFAIIKNYDDVPEPILKISGYIYDFDQNAAPLRRKLTEKYGEYADFVYAGNGWLDMLLKNTGKGFTLREVIERKGLHPDEIMVFGDNENDISMLSLTPNSYAKSHSAANVREIASYECDSVTETLKKYFINK
jgi:Cof subfamily protein (haloacid dehalogenase superfamily)